MLATSLRPDRVNARAFDLDDDAAYRRWRDWKLAHRAPDAEALTVDVTDPRGLGAAERAALLERIAQTNMALYRSPRAGDCLVHAADKGDVVVLDQHAVIEAEAMVDAAAGAYGKFF